MDGLDIGSLGTRDCKVRGGSRLQRLIIPCVRGMSMNAKANGQHGPASRIRSERVRDRSCVATRRRGALSDASA